MFLFKFTFKQEPLKTWDWKFITTTGCYNVIVDVIVSCVLKGNWKSSKLKACFYIFSKDFLSCERFIDLKIEPCIYQLNLFECLYLMKKKKNICGKNWVWLNSSSIQLSVE